VRLGHLEAVLAVLRNAGFSVELAGHASSVLDSYTYGFAAQEATTQFQTPEALTEVTEAILDQLPAGQFPYLAEMAVERVLQPGYDYGNEFAFGIDLILDGLDRSFTAMSQPGVRQESGWTPRP
jgi:hypothetical protein